MKGLLPKGESPFFSVIAKYRFWGDGASQRCVDIIRTFANENQTDRGLKQHLEGLMRVLHVIYLIKIENLWIKLFFQQMFASSWLSN